LEQLLQPVDSAVAAAAAIEAHLRLKQIKKNVEAEDWIILVEFYLKWI
jgi:hypothetical protein